MRVLFAWLRVRVKWGADSLMALCVYSLPIPTSTSLRAAPPPTPACSFCSHTVGTVVTIDPWHMLLPALLSPLYFTTPPFLLHGRQSSFSPPFLAISHWSPRACLCKSAHTLYLLSWGKALAQAALVEGGAERFGQLFSRCCGRPLLLSRQWWEGHGWHLHPQARD